MTTERVTVRMSRGDISTPWGFRLHGGSEFNIPLNIAQVVSQSLADRAGLREGDHVVQLIGKPAQDLSHKDAQDAIIAAGNNVDIVVQRSANKAWEPIVTPDDAAAQATSVHYSVEKSNVESSSGHVSGHSVTSKGFEGAHHEANQPPSAGNVQSRSPQPSAAFIEISSKTTTRSEVESESQNAASAAAPPAPAQVHISNDIGHTVAHEPPHAPHPPVMEPPRPSFTEPSHSPQASAPPPPFSHVPPPAAPSPQFTSAAVPPQVAPPSVVPSVPPQAPPQHIHGGTTGPSVHFAPSHSPPQVQHGQAPSSQDTSLTNGHQQFVHLQYNSPAPIYSKQNVAEAYLQQTGGLFGTDPKLNQEPKFLQSETLRLIRETEQQSSHSSHHHPPRHVGGYEGTLHHTTAEEQSDSFRRLQHSLEGQGQGGETVVDGHTPHGGEAPMAPSGPPICDSCGRRIFGAFCKAANKTLHGECFKCSTCGQSLKNIGFSQVDDKLYCDIHAKQHQNFSWKPNYNLRPANGTSSSPDRSTSPVKRAEPMKAFYQPEIMKRTNVQMTTKGACPLPASVRGVPSAQFGHNDSYRSSSYQYSKDTTDSSHSGTVGGPMPAAPVADGSSYSSYHTSSFKTEQQPSYAPTAPPAAPPPTHAVGPADSYDSSSYSSYHTSSFKTEQQPSYAPTTPPAAPPPTPAVAPAVSYGLPGHVDSSSDRAATQITTSMSSMSMSSTGGTPGAPPPAGTVTRPGDGPRQPRRGKGSLQQLGDHPRIPMCELCRREIRGPFVLAMQKSWCPDHFVCGNGNCRQKLLDIGFVEENGEIYCEMCFEKYFAPICGKCNKAVVGDCVNALSKQWHPHCFVCVHCGQSFGNSSFFLEDGKPYCEKDWNELYTTKCVSCEFPIEAGDRWVEALGSAYHANCFTCAYCQKELEGQSFYAKGGKPYCQAHA